MGGRVTPCLVVLSTFSVAILAQGVGGRVTPCLVVLSTFCNGGLAFCVICLSHGR